MTTKKEIVGLKQNGYTLLANPWNEHVIKAIRASDGDIRVFENKRYARKIADKIGRFW